tara:strand:+ start:169 stop:693 length:525 start_codon:yes stop_codon:yes gene_type:complete
MSDEVQEFAGSVVCSGVVIPEWIDVNDHMNVAYYVLAFDRGIDTLWAQFGVTDEYISETQQSTFAVESHVTWQRELALDEPYVITSQILAFDAKRIHQFMRMYHANNHYLAATAEWMNLHVDLRKRRVSPWPDDVLHNIEAFSRQQSHKCLPAQAGQRMKVATPQWSIEDYFGQ